MDKKWKRQYLFYLNNILSSVGGRGDASGVLLYAMIANSIWSLTKCLDIEQSATGGGGGAE
jgi:hypothetical protein